MVDKTICDDIIKRYTSAGYDLVKYYDDRKSFQFENKFSLHFVFLLKSLKELKDNWELLHQQLIDTYSNYEGPPDNEWNFYAIFVVNEEDISKVDLKKARKEIELNTTYSRKFILLKNEVRELPPYKINEEDLGSYEINYVNPLEIWEETIGKELFRAIMTGPKVSIENKVNIFIRDKVK